MNDSITAEEFTRLANNFYNSQKLEIDYNRIGIDSHLINYISQNIEAVKTNKYKVALCCICLNPLYWEYAKNMIEGAKKLFLPGHDVEFFLWSDMPPETNYGATVFETAPAEWPLATLLRYSLFLQQEEKLKEYDYIFYCDIDMQFVNVVGDEILGDGLTGAVHPMYYVRREYIPPYEPNSNSQAYIPRPGRVTNEEGKLRFEPLYFAGGFQGGKTKDFIKAMKVMKRAIDKDFSKNYMAIWNDESHWNKYLFDNPPVIVLNPGYVYPDSLVEEYYKKIWGRNFQPRLVTLTKKFTVSKEGGDAVQKMMQSL